MSVRPPVSVGLARSEAVLLGDGNRKVRIMAIAIEAERQLSIHEGALITLHVSLNDELSEYTIRVTPQVAMELIQFFQRETQPCLEPAAKLQAPARWAEACFMRT
jgi:hypothetical protein